jgi:hypothetical protein
MRLSQFIEREPPVRRKRKKKVKASVATHRAFVPILVLWGAALFGLAVIVMPQPVIDRFSALSDGSLSGASARFAFAGVAALSGAALAFVAGGALRSWALRNDSERPIAAAVHSRRVRPIDPANELGSASLDAPIEGIPFANGAEEAEFETFAETAEDIAAPDEESKREPTLGELAQRGYEMEAPEEVIAKGKSKKGQDDEIAFTHKQFQGALIESCEGATCEASTAQAEDPGAGVARHPASPVVEKRRQPAAPRSLGLEEFGALPGRNAVWVDGEAGDRRQSKGTPPVPASALEKLRQTPADELSLVEMVERFAGALHEHQNSERVRRPDGAKGRDAALVEALKALTLFTEHGFDKAEPGSHGEQLGQTERELRDALAKLQTLRGAA